VSLHHVSALKGSSSGSMTNTFQQHGKLTELPDVKLSWVSSVYYITRQL